MSAIPRNSFDTALAPTVAKSASMLNAAVLAIVKRASAVWNFWSYRRTMTQLVTLDDHMLQDIGVTRGDIRRSATLPYSDDPTTQLRILAMERCASDLVWTKNAEERRRLQVQRPRVSGCEPYRSSDQRDVKLR